MQKSLVKSCSAKKMLLRASILNNITLCFDELFALKSLIGTFCKNHRSYHLMTEDLDFWPKFTFNQTDVFLVGALFFFVKSQRLILELSFKDFFPLIPEKKMVVVKGNTFIEWPKLIQKCLFHLFLRKNGCSQRRINATTQRPSFNLDCSFFFKYFATDFFLPKWGVA